MEDLVIIKREQFIFHININPFTLLFININPYNVFDISINSYALLYIIYIDIL